MTGDFALDWAVLTVSLFNTMVLFWLGITVLLNTERRTWGVWLTGGGLVLGGAFFLSHTAILGHDPRQVSRGTDFWWQFGWALVILAPYAWYLAMLWYVNAWERWRLSPGWRDRLPFLVTTGLAVGLLGLSLLTRGLPSFRQVSQLDLSASPSVAGVSLLIPVYPLYIMLCTALSLAALHRPGPARRVMGDLARARARPWLTAASVALLVVSLLIAWFAWWVVANARDRALFQVYEAMARTVGWFDLVIASLIGVSVLLTGQAIVSYEIFTGHTLPRQGLARHWRRALILATGYSVLVALALMLQLKPIYGLLVTMLLMTSFYALLGWRSYTERERAVEQLRPFAASQQVYDQLISPHRPQRSPAEVTELFVALSRDLLGAERAYLLPLGRLRPLVGEGFAYPTGPAPALDEGLVVSFKIGTLCYPVDPLHYGGARWAVPLWNERGPLGVLLLGDKTSGGLYTQEEIEIARAGGERLMDTLASAEMAHRLMALQRQRLTESQLIDRRPRRTLHDDILPALHAAILTLGGGDSLDAAASRQTLAQLSEVHRKLSDLLRQMPVEIAPDVAQLGLLPALRRVVENEWGQAFDRVSWRVEPTAARALSSLPPLTAEVLFHAAREAIRNAARHGRSDIRHQPLHLQISALWRDGIEVRVEDDGQGIPDAGASVDGNGQGLALHSTMMAVIGGTLAVDSRPGAFTRVVLALPPDVSPSSEPVPHRNPITAPASTPPS
jgi:signal transduction histidine kinase